MRSLATNGQPPAMPETAIAAENHQSFDRLLYVAPQVALDFEVLVEHLADTYLLISGQLVAIAPQVNLCLLQNLLRCGMANAVDIGERDFHTLVSGQFDPGYACHSLILLLTLALFVARVRTENANHTLTPHHLALFADSFD
jgi:hypothetical protein